MILLKLFFLKFEGECLDDVERLIKEIYDVVNTKDIRMKRCQRRKFLNQIDDVFNNENRPTWYGTFCMDVKIVKKEVVEDSCEFSYVEGKKSRR